MTSFDEILGRLQTHFTPSEFIEFLGVDWSVLINNEQLQDLVEEHIDEIKEEIGI